MYLNRFYVETVLKSKLVIYINPQKVSYYAPSMFSFSANLFGISLFDKIYFNLQSFLFSETLDLGLREIATLEKNIKVIDLIDKKSDFRKSIVITHF